MSDGKAGASGLRLLTSAAEIRAASAAKRETVPTPAWGEDTGVLVQALDINRRLALVEWSAAQPENDPGRGLKWALALAAMGIIDEAGEPLYSVADLDALGVVSTEPLLDIAAAVSRLSGLPTGASAKESDAPLAPTDDSPSDSPSPSE